MNEGTFSAAVRWRGRRQQISVRLPVALISRLDAAVKAWSQEAKRRGAEADIDRTFVLEVLLTEGLDRES